MSVTGLDNLSKEIGNLGRKAENLCKYAIYGGAQAIANEVKNGINEIPTEQHHYVNPCTVGHDSPPSTSKISSLPDVIKGELINGFGISTMRKDGGKWIALIGFAGYSSVATKAYPSGLPLQMIARSVESGSSVRVKHPFVRPAVNRSKAAAQKAMQERAEKYINDFNF